MSQKKLNSTLGVLLVALLLDQVSKYFASLQGIVVINTGISFGLFPGYLLTLALVTLFVFFYKWSCGSIQKNHPLLTGLVLGGALSNILDRIVLGGVRDFLPLAFTGIRNNLADWFIVVPLVIILVDRKSYAN